MAPGADAVPAARDAAAAAIGVVAFGFSFDVLEDNDRPPAASIPSVGTGSMCAELRRAGELFMGAPDATGERSPVAIAAMVASAGWLRGGDDSALAAAGPWLCPRTPAAFACDVPLETPIDSSTTAAGPPGGRAGAADGGGDRCCFSSRPMNVSMMRFSSASGTPEIGPESNGEARFVLLG